MWVSHNDWNELYIDRAISIGVSALKQVMRWLSITVFCAPAFAAPPCSFTTGGGVTVDSNVVYDTVNPSGQSSANLIAFIARPTVGAGPFPVVLAPSGKGWVEQSNLCTVNQAQATALVNGVNGQQYVVIAAYTPWASGSQVVASHSIGDTSLTVSAIGGDNSNWWFPNIAGCTVDNCNGINVPFQAVYGIGASRENVTVTAQDGTGKVLTVSTLAKNHSANDYFYIPQTEFPANVTAYSSLLNWIGTNIHTYKGDPQQIHLFPTSSDAHGALMAALNTPGICLTNPNGCLPLTNYNGFDASGSSNSLSSWKIVAPVTPVGVPWDLNWMWTNSSTGGIPGAVQHVIPALIGCIPGTDTSCTAVATAASPTTYLRGTGYVGPITSATGNDDFTTPPCPVGSMWGSNADSPSNTPFQAPCAGNMYAATNTNFVVFQGGGTGHGADCKVNFTATGQCYQWWTGAAGGNPIGSAYISGNVKIDGNATIK